jgi:hypothetical protein
MHDPIGDCTRIRELYLSYLDTAFRIEDQEIVEERQTLLRSAGALCTEPLLELKPVWALTMPSLVLDAHAAITRNNQRPEQTSFSAIGLVDASTPPPRTGCRCSMNCHIDRGANA